MKKIIHYILIITVSFALIGCMGVEDEASIISSAGITAADITEVEIQDIRTGDLRKTVFALVSSAENSSINYSQQYGYIEDIGDGRGYTAVIIGFTSGTGDLLIVVKKYIELKPIDNALRKYIPALEKANGTDSHKGLGVEFVADWQEAAEDAKMLKAQNSVVDEMYLSPAVVYANEDGLSVLGQYIYYDALVMHGPGEEADSFGGIRKVALAMALPPTQGGSEETYLLAFLKVRETIMQKEAAHEDLSRLATQNRFIAEENYALTLPLEWTMYGDRFILTSKTLNLLP